MVNILGRLGIPFYSVPRMYLDKWKEHSFTSSGVSCATHVLHVPKFAWSSSKQTRGELND
jgi:hypothetical protein